MKRRGFTLVEVLVASGIGLMLMYVLATCWSVATRAWTQAGQLGTTQRDTLTLSYRLRHDYSNAMVGSLVVTPTLISFVSEDVLTWSSTGSPQWSHWVQYYYTPSAGTVQRRTVLLPNAPTATVPATPPPAWGSGPSELLASSVTMFSVVTPPLGGGPTLQISLRTQVNSSTSRIDLGLLPQLYGQD